VVPKYVKHKKIAPKTCFWGFVTPPPHTKKTIVKNWKNELVPACDSEAIFFCDKYSFEGGGDGRSFGGFIFLAMQGQPSRTPAVP
jgi:hypothetical protein